MSSVQKYFRFSMGTLCGIPGVEMKGEREDWERLLNKTQELQTLLAPIMTELGLGSWFRQTATLAIKLLDTYDGQPDTEWWSHILSWTERNGSGFRSSWDGWMIDFLRAENQPSSP